MRDGDIAGGGIFLLENPGHTPATRDLVQGRLPRGNYTTLALSFDQRTLYFAFAERASAKPDFYSPQRRSFHLFALDVDGGHLRQLTQGVEDDFDPCPLPDGGIAFMSTRRQGYARCFGAQFSTRWDVYTLHRMNGDGSNIRTLSFHDTNEWFPAVSNTGHILYARCDYIDRSSCRTRYTRTTHILSRCLKS